jgi:hypothetical protein
MRELVVTPSNRHCVLNEMARPSAAALRREILRNQGIQDGFSVLTAPAPAHDATVFKVAGNDSEVLVAVALFDSLRHLSPPGSPARDTLEILIDPRMDRLGYVQFILSPGAENAAPGEVNPHRDSTPASTLTRLQFQPYPEASGSGYDVLSLKRWETREEFISRYSISSLRIQWFFLWFDARALFARGDRVGFNIARFRPCLHEFSSWNYCSGNGSPDATAFGTLHRKAPGLVLEGTKAVFSANELALSGQVKGKRVRTLALRLTAPDGASETIQAPVKTGAWSIRVPVTMPIPGRYRLGLEGTGEGVEPDFTALDLPDRALRESFKVSLLFDTPMCMVANYYTPARLRSQMQVIREIGFDRIHWMDYGRWPSFWKSPERPWARFGTRSMKECPDLLLKTVTAAHQAGLEFIGDLKVFDLGFNCFFVKPGPRGWGATREIENHHSCVIPEMEAHPEWTWQDRPEWRRAEVPPVTRIRFYSLDPIPRLNPDGLRLLVSDDNKTFRAIRRKGLFRQGRVHRPNQRWTPGGLKTDPGSQTNYYIEWSGLSIAEPYLAVESDVPFRLRNRGFMAVDVRGAGDRETAHTLATNGDRKSGLFFWKGWQGWNNVDEAILQERVWEGGKLGLVFREADRMPTLLEPAYEGARNIWLGRVAAILAAGADGVSIRTYCHHNGPMHYLKYAYAPPIVDAFRALTGRDPEADPSDDSVIRRIRGDFFSQFIRDASTLVRGAGKKFMVEFESGLEIPATLSSRMQLPLEWKRWIEEGWLDEIRLKYFTAENTFIHRQILPAARARGIPVQLISRCLHQGVDVRTREMAEILGTRAAQSGFAGYCLYEQLNLMEVNSEGETVLKGPVKLFVRSMRETI